MAKFTLETFNFKVSSVRLFAGETREAAVFVLLWRIRTKRTGWFSVGYLGVLLPFGGHIPWYSDTHLKLQLCSNPIAILGSSLYIMHISHLWWFRLWVSEGQAPGWSEPHRNSERAHFSNLDRLPHSSGLCYEPPTTVLCYDLTGFIQPSFHNFTRTHRV